MTIETNLTAKGELKKAAERLLDAAMDYWKAYAKETGGSGVVWVSDTDGRLVVLTRGEYRDDLLANIHRLPREHEMIRSFGSSPVNGGAPHGK